MKRCYLLLLSVSFALEGCTQQPDPKYFNQKPPSSTPEVFAPGIVSQKDEFEFGAVYSVNRNEFYYSVYREGKAETRVMKFENGKWTSPETILIHDAYSFNDPVSFP